MACTERAPLVLTRGDFARTIPRWAPRLKPWHGDQVDGSVAGTVSGTPDKLAASMGGLGQLGHFDESNRLGRAALDGACFLRRRNMSSTQMVSAERITSHGRGEAGGEASVSWLQSLSQRCSPDFVPPVSQ